MQIRSMSAFLTTAAAGTLLLTGCASHIDAASESVAVKTSAAQSTDREVRRKDYLLTEQEACYVIEHTNNAVLGTADASGTPYAVPITPLLLDGKIYFHRKNPRKPLISIRGGIGWKNDAVIPKTEYINGYGKRSFRDSAAHQSGRSGAQNPCKELSLCRGVA